MEPSEEVRSEAVKKIRYVVEAELQFESARQNLDRLRGILMRSLANISGRKLVKMPVLVRHGEGLWLVHASVVKKEDSEGKRFDTLKFERTKVADDATQRSKSTLLVEDGALETEGLRHKAGQYDAVVKAVQAADGGRYRNDTINALLKRLAKDEALRTSCRQMKDAWESYLKNPDEIGWALEELIQDANEALKERGE